MGHGKECIMKNKIVTVFLGCALIFSISLNIYLYHSLTTTRGQVAVFSEQVVVADDQINDLNSKLSDFEDLQSQVEQLEKQVADKESQIGILEQSISESEAQIKSLEAVIAESEATIAELERQQQNIEKTVVTQPLPQSSIGNNDSKQSANPPSGLGNMGTFGGSMGTGTGAGSAYGEVGTFE